MQIVAGLSLKNLKPRVWDPDSPYYLPDLDAVMVSYAEFDQFPAKRGQAMEQGLRAFLGVSDSTRIYLDNGSFAVARLGKDVDVQAYEEFVAIARPDWWPVPQDFIPAPSMSREEIEACLRRTMEMNRRWACRGDVPVIHVGSLIHEYLHALEADEHLLASRDLGLGGIVPNLLRSPKALPYADILDAIRQVRMRLADTRAHLFGVGGIATLHLAMLLGIDSADSSGWRNRAARGIVQLPGHGDRSVADLGSWSGRRPTHAEWMKLALCRCPACRRFGPDGLRKTKLEGFCNRATHNLWTLLEESKLINAHLRVGSYRDWYVDHIRNSIYRPLIEYVIESAELDRLGQDRR
jgi:queuine/archaeosine tRNA-ribosyltransferase